MLVLAIVAVAALLIGVYFVLQRRAVAGAQPAASARVAAAWPVDDAGALDWQEVAGTLRVADDEDIVQSLGLTTQEVARGTDVRGSTHVVGERHGRHVDVTVKEGSSRVELGGGAVRDFVVRGHGDTLVAEPGAPGVLVSAVEALAPSERWSGVRATGGGHGVTVTRDGNGSHESWYHDLWLAEHLADAAAPRGGTARG